MIKEFVGRMYAYADYHHLGKPTLLFGQTTDHFGIALDWPDHRRSFTFNRSSWTGDDYEKLCNALRNW